MLAVRRPQPDRDQRANHHDSAAQGSRSAWLVRLSCLVALILLSPIRDTMAQSLQAQPLQAHPEQSADVVIVGAGTGGISAALQAARLGAQVALLEETDWVGGQMAAAGDSTMNEGGTITLASGIYAEFLRRMQAWYQARGKSVGTCYWKDTNHCYEPLAIRRVLLEMIDDVNHEGKGHISLYLRERVVKVLGTEQVVTGVVTENNHIFHSKVVIDATEFGDVLPLTAAAYRMGRFTSAEPGKSCIQDINYEAVIRKYPNGVPPGLLMKHAPPGYDAAFVADMRRFLRSDGNGITKDIPVNFAMHNECRALPDSANPENYTASTPDNITRTLVNFFNDYPADTDIFDRSKRRDIVCAAKLRTLDFIYYVQHDLKETSWSIANDEGYDTPYNREENSCPNIPQEFKALEVNFPLIPYVRESRRLIGEYTLVGGDIRREQPWPNAVNRSDIDPAPIFKDAIAVGDYTEYLHDCNTEADYEHDLEHATDMPREFRNGPFQIPLETLIPEKVDGLLAAEKNISESRIANSSTRLQPITMLTGQAAGALAAIAALRNVQPRQVDPAVVQRVLLDFNSDLTKEALTDLPPDGVQWRAAEFAIVHDWLGPAPDGFAPLLTLTRAQAAHALTSAFYLFPAPTAFERRWGYQLASNATFKDVPLYSKQSPDVEALAEVGAARPCAKEADLFCPDDVETVADFVSSLAVLKSRSADRPSGAAPTQLSAESKSGATTAAMEGAGNITDAPLTRIRAAEILYRSLGSSSQTARQ
jgi:hypothetical protein